MRVWTYAFSIVVAATWLAVPGVATAQEMPTLPKPGPEHELLAADVGVWDAAVEVFAPGAPPVSSRGVETNTMGCGGLCLISDFTGEMMPGQAFHGHGVTTWDPGKKKYVGSWTDSMSRGLGVGESTYDAATKSVRGSMSMPDATGAMTTMTSVVEHKDDRRIFTMYAPGPDGKDVPTMRITYTRRK